MAGSKQEISDRNKLFVREICRECGAGGRQMLLMAGGLEAGKQLGQLNTLIGCQVLWTIKSLFLMPVPQAHQVLHKRQLLPRAVPVRQNLVPWSVLAHGLFGLSILEALGTSEAHCSLL